MSISTADKRFLQKLGSPQEIRRDLKKFRDDVLLFMAERPNLARKYPGKWVAFHGGKVVGIADSLDDLLVEIDKQGLQRDAVITQFLSKKKLTMVL